MGIRVAIPPFDTPPQAEQFSDLCEPPMDLMDETCAQRLVHEALSLEPKNGQKYFSPTTLNCCPRGNPQI